MNQDPVILSGNDTMPVLPPDRFIKSEHDTTIEGKTVIYGSRAESKSIFTGHLLKPAGIEPKPVNAYQPDWILALLLACFVLQAWVQYVYRKRFRQLVLAPFSKRFMNQMIRDGNLFNERLSLALGMVYMIGITLLIYEVNEMLLGGYSPYPVNRITIFAVILAGMLVYWFLKVTGIRMLGKVFKTENTTGMYLLNILVVNIITGILLIPLLVMVVYMKSVIILYLTIGIIVLSLLFLFIRGFFIGLSLTKFSYVFLFVYLCTLEILPLIILIKIFLIYYQAMIHVK